MGATDDFSSRVCDALCAVVTMDLNGLSLSTSSLNGEVLVSTVTSSINTNSSNSKNNISSIISTFSSNFLSVASKSVSIAGTDISGSDQVPSRSGEEKVMVAVSRDDPAKVVGSRGGGEKKTSGRGINPNAIAAKLAALREGRGGAATGAGIHNCS